MTANLTARSDKRRTILRGIAALVVVVSSLIGAEAGAQSASIGVGSARINLSARLYVGYHMKVRQSQSARIVERTATATEVELPVTAASNASWTLSVANPAGVDQQISGIEVLDANGTWRDLNDGATTPVYASGQPTNGQPVTVRLRLAPGATLDSLAALRFLMTPSEGAN